MVEISTSTGITDNIIEVATFNQALTTELARIPHRISGRIPHGQGISGLESRMDKRFDALESKLDALGGCKSLGCTMLPIKYRRIQA